MCSTPSARPIDEKLDVTVTNFGLHVNARSGGTGPTAITVAVTGSAKILAGPGCAGDPAFDGADASLLFRLSSGATTSFVAGARLSGLNVQQLSCEIPFDWTLPTVALTVADAKLDTPWLTLDQPTKDFFQPILCPGSTVCPLKLEVDQGLSLRSLVTIDRRR